MKVLKAFKDLKDGGHIYQVGDNYPRAGYKPDAKRIAELSGSKNALGEPIIEAEKPAEEPQPEKKPAKKKGKK